MSPVAAHGGLSSHVGTEETEVTVAEAALADASVA